MKTYKTYKDLYDYIEIGKNTSRHSHYRKGVLTIAMMMLEPIISNKPDSPLPTSRDVLKRRFVERRRQFLSLRLHRQSLCV